MPARVVDASVIAAIAFNEPRSDEALALVDGADLFAPDLLPYELCSVALKKTLRHPAQANQIETALVIALNLDIKLLPMANAEVVSLALKTRVTVYDAAYLHLAFTLGHPLATFDRRLARAARSGT